MAAFTPAVYECERAGGRNFPIRKGCYQSRAAGGTDPDWQDGAAAPPGLTNIFGATSRRGQPARRASLLVGPCEPGVGFEAGKQRWLFAGLRECRVEAPSANGSAVISVIPTIRCISARKHDDDGAIIGDGFTSPGLQQTEEIFKAAAVIRAIGGHNAFKTRGVESYRGLGGCWVGRVGLIRIGIVNKAA